MQRFFLKSIELLFLCEEKSKLSCSQVKNAFKEMRKLRFEDLRNRDPNLEVGHSFKFHDDETP